MVIPSPRHPYYYSNLFSADFSALQCFQKERICAAQKHCNMNIACLCQPFDACLCNMLRFFVSGPVLFVICSTRVVSSVHLRVVAERGKMPAKTGVGEGLCVVALGRFFPNRSSSCAFVPEGTGVCIAAWGQGRGTVPGKHPTPQKPFFLSPMLSGLCCEMSNNTISFVDFKLNVLKQPPPLPLGAGGISI